MSVIPDNFIILPSLDLSEQEALENALGNLTKLEHQFTKICTSLDHRLSGLKGKVGEFNNRIGTARQKIESLRDVNEAITVINPSRFLKDYKKDHSLGYHYAVNNDFVNNRKISIVNYENNMNLNPNIVPNHVNPLKSLRQVAAKNKQHEDELSHIVKSARGNFNTQRELFSGPMSIQNQRHRGLGDVRKDIKSIDSLILFNSNKNPYRSYVPIDNTVSNNEINVPLRKKHKAQQEPIVEDVAPPTMSSGSTMPVFAPYELGFKPTLKKHPDLIAPRRLNLGGIVNMALSDDETETITPSVGGTVNKPTLPDPLLLEPPSSQAPNLIDAPTLSMQRFSHIVPIKKANNPSALSSSDMNQASRPVNRTGSVQYAPVISDVRPVISNNKDAEIMDSQPVPSDLGSSSSSQNQLQSRKEAAASVQNTENLKETPIREASNPNSSQKNKENAPAQPVRRAAPKGFLEEIANPAVRLVKPKPVEKGLPPLQKKRKQSTGSADKENTSENIEKGKGNLADKPSKSPPKNLLDEIMNPPVKLVKPKPVEKKIETNEKDLMKIATKKRWEAMNKNAEKRSRRWNYEDDGDDDDQYD